MPTAANIRRRWFQFSLRTLLIVMLIVGGSCGWFLMKFERARKLHKAVTIVREASMDVFYADQFDAGQQFLAGSSPWAPQWLRNLLTDEFFRTPTLAAPVDKSLFRSFKEIDRPALLAAVVQVDTLQRLKLDGIRLNGLDLAQIDKLVQLEQLGLSGSELTDVDLRPLIDQLVDSRRQRLTHLNLSATRITDAILPDLARLEKLQFLELSQNRFDSKGMDALRSLYGYRVKMSDLGRIAPLCEQVIDELHLYDLELFGPQPKMQEKLRQLKARADAEMLAAVITPLPTGELTALTNIRDLLGEAIQNERLTEAAIAKLQAALPNCTIEY